MRPARRRSPDEADRVYAFYTDNPPGTGADILFTGYDAFASLAAISFSPGRQLRIRVDRGLQDHWPHLRLQPEQTVGDRLEEESVAACANNAFSSNSLSGSFFRFAV